MKKTLVIIGFLITGCTFLHQDFDKYDKNYKEIPLSSIKVGDKKDQVSSSLGEPDNVIGSKSFEHGTIEVWSYEKWHANLGMDTLEQVYWLYFLDDILVQWGRPGDWQREADRIYELRVR
jgi:hypothetical protein